MEKNASEKNKNYGKRFFDISKRQPQECYKGQNLPFSKQRTIGYSAK